MATVGTLFRFARDDSLAVTTPVGSLALAFSSLRKKNSSAANPTNLVQPLRVIVTFPRAKLVMPLLKTHMSNYWHAGPRR